MREFAFFALMVGALASQSLVALANDRQPTPEEFKKMDCTRAVEWMSKDIIDQQPAGTLPAKWKRGDAETTALRILSQIHGSPCFPEVSPSEPRVK